MSSDPLLPPDSDSKPIPPGGEPITPFATGSTQMTSLGLEPNIEAGLSVLLPPLTGIIFFVLEKRNQFVRFWAMQAIFFGAAALVISIVMTVITMILIFIPLIGSLWIFASRVVSLGLLLVWLYMLFQAFTGKTWELPILGKMARQQLSKQPPVL